MKLYIDKRVVIGFVTSLIILIWLGYFSYQNNQDFINTRALVLHTNEVLQHIEQVNSNASRTEELVSKLVITGDSEYLANYTREIDKAREHYNRLRELTADNIEQRALIDTFVVYGTNKYNIHKKIIDTLKNSKIAAELLLGSVESKKTSDRIYKVISEMSRLEKGLLTARVNRSLGDMREFQFTFSLLMLSNLIIISLVFLMINRSFRARLIAETRTKQINQELESFTYSVSHDLRAPLRSIRGFTEVLKEEYSAKLDEEGNRLLRIVMNNASRMGQLIDDLLDFSRMGRRELSYSDIDVQQLVTEVIHDLTAHENRSIHWDIHSLENARGDLSMLKQVWINLISNAIKYSRKTAEPRVEIGCEQIKGNRVYYVKDNGVGFDMKYSDKLFKVFQRLHSHQEFEGTGVGLALVHRIISKHRGEIWAESKVNEGTTFYFYTKSLTT
ncbi:MAG: ATP-binding protein [Cyclobacteriaceae bacterium]|nr:CHASE3 domain-containing protein [Cyclobacteriaceae bacterium]